MVQRPFCRVFKKTIHSLHNGIVSFSLELHLVVQVPTSVHPVLLMVLVVPENEVEVFVWRV